MAILPQIDRYFVVTPAVHGDILDLGPGASGSLVGTVTIQFQPDVNFVGSFVLVARSMGQQAKDNNAAFLPIPYHRATVNNVASDYAIVSDQISGACLIDIPANGKDIGLLVSCTAGSCAIFPWSLTGSGAV